MLGTHRVIPRAQERPVASNRHAGHRNIGLGYQLMRAFILPQVPDPHAAPSIAGNQLPLIRMNHHIVDRALVQIVPLNTPRPRIPDLDRAILGARDHPFALAMESDARDVARVPVERQHGVRIRGADVVELDVVVPRGGEVALVGRDAEPVDLGVRVLDCARADAREGFPEADRVVVTSWRGGVGWSA